MKTIGLLLVICCAGFLVERDAMAQTATWAAVPEKVSGAPSADEMRSLADLLSRPAIQAWLRAQSETPEPVQMAKRDSGAAKQAISAWLSAVRSSTQRLAGVMPNVPTEIARASAAVAAEARVRGAAAIILPLGLMLASSFGLEWMFWLMTAGLRARIIARKVETAEERLRAVGLRVLYGIGIFSAFASGCVVAFVAFDWPPLLQQVLLTLVMSYLVVRLVFVAGRMILAPGADKFRLLPMSTRTARFWFVWSAVLIGWFCFTDFALELFTALGVNHDVGYLVALGSRIVLLALALLVLWRCPTFDGANRVSDRHRIGACMLSFYFLATWLVAWSGIAATFYIGVLLLVLPVLLRCTKLAVAHTLRAADADGDRPLSLTAVALERGLRAILLIGSAYLLAGLLNLDLGGALAADDSVLTRLVRGSINAGIIIMLADLCWRIASTWIDQRIVQSDDEPLEGEAARRLSRLRTLLPIVRNMLFVVLFVVAALMVLSGLGIEIAPLIAGAGVVGIAVGFGAQTLVKDVISGMFFLLDDAFRVGEYIESSNIKGRVESFSLRSVKLRHHRGALHTIPFGSLEKITNYSRDWAIDKITVNVTYETDLDAVKRIVRQVGQQLLDDPELAPNIMEPLKMQGVAQFGDFAIQIRMKVMTKPGEQFDVRRRAYALIKKAFDANGIKFAFPTVTVAGGDQQTGAAQKALELLQAGAAAE
ncbi:mechanosensitive ion channel family protein [Ensifer adhaerens]|uniref:mechanosensitive ion channel family protein n=1 Tax=Ensifer canadensis TaxID=555315 RepID=UPI001490646F|nr:mechanosensitive ion channel family protein [Ensifer canadensis]NOV20212.1 mechanosensitive ion channel family protein [Ensifer canadensis]